MESRRPEWEVRTYGDQLDDIDIDLMAQIVIMLGRELIQEAAEKQTDQDGRPTP
jgi:hypothetical protein